jgi:hypothetical protein
MINKNSYSFGKQIRGLWFFAGIFTLLIILATPARAQEQLCYPDCDSSIWMPMPPAPALTFLITLPCGEPVIVHYRTRIACGSWLDLLIEQIDFVNGYAGGQHCGQTMSVAQMLEAAMIQMIIADPMGFPPNPAGPDTCFYNYRVMVGGCWKPTFPIGTGGLVSQAQLGGIQPDLPGGFLYPCEFISCCLQLYTVCIVNHQKVITYNPKLSVPGQCDPRWYQLGCYPACQ